MVTLYYCVYFKSICFVIATELQLGELVHHQKLFGLFEAMSAIEMMDPKMDAGCNKIPGGPLTFESAVTVRHFYYSTTIDLK